ncbi:alkaline phosphatase [Pseudomassariella vexata]|uniref:Alkaline phosphatase n=1 Tax=Pseudomassariella vexata TaxID=1141098 RepID=A0A1Y2ECD7_9PEZI|nr:alkaline phosphatase [Pseudomassariella vexata]ORY68505.1 alkaline phosphatase [Pseudomassariella vexata]
MPRRASATTPLLADDRHDSASESEDDALRGSSASAHTGRSLYMRLREVFLFGWALLATAGILIMAVWVSHNSQTHFSKPAGKRNLIFMVSDGMGPASLSLTRSFRQYTEGLEYGDTLTLDKHFWGSSRTRSSSSLVTDSAAGATAFSCGKKSYNGAISILPDKTPCGTVLEAAKRAGFVTGLVVTTDITDATPACFASHVDLREQEDEIAMQEVGEGPLGRVVDLMFGGGRCHFLPNGTEGSCRADDVDVVDIAKSQHGWNYIDSRAGFDALWEGKVDIPLPMLGLFADTDFPFELDRRNMNEVYPSLSEMAKTAIRALEKATVNSDKGFFLMIEGSRIDHAGHGNDPAAQVREVLEYDKAFKFVIDFLKESKTEGVLVATSDHETGGLSIARQNTPGYPEYLWYPAVLANASSSSEYLAKKLHRHIASLEDPSMLSVEELTTYINDELVVPGLGISDASDSELAEIVKSTESAQPLLAKMVSVRAQIGWSTHGHSAVDVNVYSSGGPGTEEIRGNRENSEIGQFLRNYIDVDVEAITKELVEKMDRKPSFQSVEATTAKEGDHWAAHEDFEMRRLTNDIESS